MSAKPRSRPLFDPPLVRRAVFDAVRKLAPARQVRNPVMFTVYVGSLLTTVLFLQSLLGHGEASPGFTGAIACWLWFTVLSPTSPRPWPRAGARPTPIPCAGPSGTPRQKRGPPPPAWGRPPSCPRPPCNGGTCFWWKPGMPSPATARSWTASPRWTNRPSPANRLRSSGRPAATARPSPAAPACSRTGWWSGSRPNPARPSSTA